MSVLALERSPMTRPACRTVAAFVQRDLPDSRRFRLRVTARTYEGTEEQESASAQATPELSGPKALEHLHKHAQHARERPVLQSWPSPRPSTE